MNTFNLYDALIDGNVVLASDIGFLLLFSDGSVHNNDGNVVLPADTARSNIYSATKARQAALAKLTAAQLEAISGLTAEQVTGLDGMAAQLTALAGMTAAQITALDGIADQVTALAGLSAAQIGTLDAMTAPDNPAPCVRVVNIGAPADISADLTILGNTPMKNGAYEIGATPNPDMARNVWVGISSSDTADTMGTITVAGTDYAGNAITEVITPVANDYAYGVNAFKTVTSVTGAGWVIDEVEAEADNIYMGYGDKIGLPLALSSTDDVVLGIFGTSIENPNAAVSDPASIAGSTIDMSAGNYDGTTEALVFLKV